MDLEDAEVVGKMCSCCISLCSKKNVSERQIKYGNRKSYQSCEVQKQVMGKKFAVVVLSVTEARSDC